MSAQHQVTYGTSIISFTIGYSSRKTMAITVFPNCKVEVTAPLDATTEKIVEKVEKRASWILKKIRMYSKHQVYARRHEWVSGESFYYLGRQYRLKVSQGEPSVKLSGKFLLVSVPNKANHVKVKELVNKWYRHQAQIKFTAAVDRNSSILRRENIRLNQVMVRQLEKRWGSCSVKGNIILNVDLVKAPVDCINYVVVHEMCHLKHFNHGRKFFATLIRHCPEWPRLKAKLERTMWV